MTKAEFHAGWLVLEQTYRRDHERRTKAEEEGLATKKRAYFSVLGFIDAPAWDATVRRCLSTCRFFPTPAELLQAFNELGHRQRGGPEAEANAAFDLVAQSTVHALLHVQPQTFRCWVCRPSEDDAAEPECRNCGGRGSVRRKASAGCTCIENRWDRRLLEERLGKAAADGFVAAGGEGAFADLKESDPFIRKRFAEAYLAALAVERGVGVPLPMLEASQAKALPESVVKIGAEESERLLRLIPGGARE